MEAETRRWPVVVAALLLMAGTVVVGRLAPPNVVAKQQPGAWITLAPMNDPRQEVAVAALDSKIYVIGGFHEDGSSADTVEVYHPAADRWDLAAPLPLSVNHSMAAAVDGRLFAIGGHPPSGAEAVANVYELDRTQNRWLARAPMPTARGSLAVGVVEGKIYAVGGLPGPNENDFAVYDPATDAWTELPPMPTPRNHLAAAVLGGKFYAVGGRSDLLGGNTPVLEEFDPGTNRWSTRAAMPTARGGIAAVAVGGQLYVFGGEGNRRDPRGMFDNVEAYVPATDSWRRLPPMAVPRHGISAAAIGNRVYIPGGATVEGFGVTPIHQALDIE